MKAVCLGGGPAGLYFAISMKLRDPAHQVTVIERNKADDTFGWGVVLSDDALEQMQENDPQSTQTIRDQFAYWDDIAVEHDGVRTEYESIFKPDIDIRRCKFIWLGTHQKFNDAFTFIFERTDHGWMWAHVYQFDDNTATFIVECLQPTWDGFGFATCPRRTPWPPVKRCLRNSWAVTT